MFVIPDASKMVTVLSPWNVGMRSLSMIICKDFKNRFFACSDSFNCCACDIPARKIMKRTDENAVMMNFVFWWFLFIYLLDM